MNEKMEVAKTKSVFSKSLPKFPKAGNLQENQQRKTISRGLGAVQMTVQCKVLGCRAVP